MDRDLLSAAPPGSSAGGSPNDARQPDTLRISCAALCRIEHGDRLLLLLNSNRRRKGIYVLGPVGGALDVYDLDPLAAWGARLEDPTRAELRLTLPEAALPDFRRWFYTGVGRERSPFRELQEELVTESGLLPGLTPDDVAIHLLWTHEREALTNRSGQTGLRTYYFLEVYEVRITAWSALAFLLEPPASSGAAWVTREQVQQRRVLTLEVDGASHPAQIDAYMLVEPPR